MIVGIPVFNGVDLLDIAAPYEVLNWMTPSVRVLLVAENVGTVTTRDGLGFDVPNRFGDVNVDILWVPGGDPAALSSLINDPSRAYLDFLAMQGHAPRFVCSVCTGAILLAAAGLLDGYEATTHWLFMPCLEKFPNIKIADGHPRYVLDRNRLTGGGISSRLDQALKLVELLGGSEAAKNVQRTIQYYPQRPVQSTIPVSPRCPLQ